MALTQSELAELSRRLDQALALPEAAREAWLAALPDELLAGVPLRERLRRLLGPESETQATPLGTLPRLSEPAAHAGERVGPWRLLREIGHGGMGTVWLAERADGAYGRLVALKLPRIAFSEQLVARMARERHIAARLEHPAIARLYDAGLDEQGRPFIAMEYVDGVAIDQWVREQRLGVTETLALFVQVVRAVAHAHGRLVVHRDIKPSNVLVGRDGQAHLLDFGIAKLLGGADGAEGAAGADEAVAPTAEAGRALTPHYAAPEQLAGGAVGVQADVYSLGVLLHELLTGRLPARPADGNGARPRASTLAPDPVRARALRGELDAILAKAMALLPADRYASADALAEDLQRHLRGDSISATPDSPTRLLWRALRRHRRGVATGVLGLAALGVGGTLALVQAHRAQQAQAREHQARALVSELVGELLALDHQGLSQEQALQRQAERVRARLPEDDALAAALHGQLAGTFLQLGLAHFAAENAQQQVALLERTGGETTARVLARLTLARAQLENQDSDAAERTARDALALAAGQPALDAEARVVLVRVLNRQARRDEAQRVIAGLPQPLPLTGPGGQLAQAWLDYTAAVARRQAADFAGAEPLYQRAITRASEAGTAGAADAAQMKLDLAYELIVRNRRAEAQALMEPALQAIAARGPTGAALAAAQRASLVTNMALMGQIPVQQALDGLGGLREAMRQQGSSLNPLALARLDFHRARLLGLHGHVREAWTLLDRAVPLLLTTTRWPNARYSLVNAQGRLALLAGEHARADALTAEALRLRTEMGQARIPFAAVSHAYVAMAGIMTGRFDAAERALDAAPVFPPEASDPVSGAVYAVLLPWHRARLLLERGDLAGAQALARTLGRGDEDPTDTDFLSPQAIRAELACAGGRAAIGLLELDILIQRRTPNVDANVDPTLARYQALAGLCALALRRWPEARRRAEAAAAAFERQPEVSPWFKAPLQQLQRQLRQSPGTPG
jgi:eukaryotic-like serine/threonine-protein kinase